VILFWSLGGSVQVFHEQNFVAILVVNQLINHFLGEQDSISAGAHAFGIAQADVAEGRVVGIGDCGMGDLVERESGAGDP